MSSLHVNTRHVLLAATAGVLQPRGNGETGDRSFYVATCQCIREPSGDRGITTYM